MPKFFSNPILESCIALLCVALPNNSWARSGPRLDYCRGTEAKESPTMFYSVAIPRAPLGTPLDVALRMEQSKVALAHEEAKSAFLDRTPDRLKAAMEDYTFLTPESERDTCGLGDLLAMTEISAALRYRRLLWKGFIARFTTVREAVSEDPYVLRFQVSLDLGYFCRYRKRVEDLVTQK